MNIDFHDALQIAEERRLNKLWKNAERKYKCRRPHLAEDNPCSNN